MAKRSDAGNGIQVISRSGRILRALAGERSGLSLSDVAERLGLPRSTVHRIMTALEAEGLTAAASPNGRYRLGPEILRLAAGQHAELRHLLRPLLEQLSAQVNETVDLAVLIRDHVSFIDQVAAPQRLRAVSAIGASFPAHCTANGKALLAELSHEALVRLLPDELPRLTETTIVDRDALLDELATVREAGLAFDREEHHEGISAVGAVVRDGSGAVAAVSIPVPTQRFRGTEQDLALALRSSCSRMSALLTG